MSSRIESLLHLFVPSLLHMSSVKTAASFFTEFGVQILDKVFAELEQRNTTACQNATENNREESRAKERLLVVPAHLRATVVRTVHGLGHAIEEWRKDHRHIFEFKDENVRFYCRSDGSVDAVKTAQNLVINKKFSLKQRFQIACMYCFEQSVLTLWETMTALGRTEDLDNEDNCMVRFWLRWLREGHSVPWVEAARLYLDPPRIESLFYTRFSAFLPLLGLEDRRKYLNSLRYTSFDDLRFSLYALTKEEEKEIAKEDVTYLLFLHLSWPLQTLFVEAAEKLWIHISGNDFRCLLSCVLYLNRKWKDFDYSEIFEYLWNKGSDQWRKSAKENPYLCKRIYSFFDGKKERSCKYVNSMKYMCTSCILM